MTAAERRVLILTADLLVMATRANAFTSVQSARTRLIGARGELDAEAFRLAALEPGRLEAIEPAREG
jgi:hypothetical protein